MGLRNSCCTVPCNDAEIIDRMDSYPSVDQDETSSEEIDTADTSLPPFFDGRRGGVSTEACGAFYQQYVDWEPEDYPKTEEHRTVIFEAFRKCPVITLQCECHSMMVDEVVDMTELRNYAAGEKICKSDDAFGEEVICVLIHGRADVQQGAVERLTSRRGTVATISEPGHLFGECRVMFGLQCKHSVYAIQDCLVGVLRCEDLFTYLTRAARSQRDLHEKYIRKVKMFETFSAEKIAKIADVVEVSSYRKNEFIIEQNSSGDAIYVLVKGQCVAEKKTGNDIQVHRNYSEGSCFGELGFKRGRRDASVRAKDFVQVFSIIRRRLERMLGRFQLLQEQDYMHDPRKTIRDFYRKGDGGEPGKGLGFCGQRYHTDLFAVFRPTSNDAIAKMLEGVAVGKGLNVKGKSAKAGILSGFVPFLQISDNDHKADVEKPSPDATFHIFFQTKDARTAAYNQLVGIMREPLTLVSRGSCRIPTMQTSPRRTQVVSRKTVRSKTVRKQLFRGSLRQTSSTSVDRTPSPAPRKTVLIRRTSGFGRAPSGLNRPVAAQPCCTMQIGFMDEYNDLGAFGLIVPECIVHEAFLIRPDLTFPIEWATGRQSEPDFMNMNLHSLRDAVPPKVVLFQFDKNEPMNPRGLLIAYQEAQVKPVVSDFDAFLVGRRGLPPSESELAKDQQEVAAWSLDRSLEILRTPSGLSWCARWLKVLRIANAKGYHPKSPPLGNGDKTSYRLIEEVIATTQDSGAVRHGAECFNFYFPQELDKNYLVLANGIEPWAYMNEAELREFLLARIEERYTFPLNPVWPVRDEGWYTVYEELKRHGQVFPKHIEEKIEAIHKEFPKGFYTIKEKEEDDGDDELDLDHIERADLLLHRSNLWKELRSTLRTYLDMPNLGAEVPRRLTVMK